MQGVAGNLRERAERTCALSCRNSTASPFVWRKAVHVKASPPLFLPSPLCHTHPAYVAAIVDLKISCCKKPACAFWPVWRSYCCLSWRWDLLLCGYQ